VTSFWYLMHAEWTKFRTVRGWVVAVLLTIAATTAFVFVATGASSSCVGPSGPSACPVQPTGPGGVPVIDSFYLVHQPVTGNGMITVQLTSLTGQAPWSKAGIILKENTSEGSAYAAMMVTGSNGVRLQWDYVNDTPGLAGGVSAAAPRWLRLVRDGGTITGYDSADGARWTLVGTAPLPGLTSTVQAGLFAAGSYYDSSSCTSDSSFCTQATGVFRHLGLSWPATGWAGTTVGGGPNSGLPVPGTFRQGAGTLTVASYGDIGPAAGNAYGGTGQSLQRALDGTFFGLIPLIVVAAMFMTAEYRRGLIRVSLAAAPRRGWLLAAKAVVIGAVGFVAGLVAAALSLVVGTHLMHGPMAWPVSLLTEARMVAGTGVLLAVAAVLALAIATIVRRSASAIAIAIVVTVVPYLLAFHPGSQPQGSGPGGGGGWPLQVTPAAALSLQQAVPQFHQLLAVYPLVNGYYPLAPWAGLAVECAWAAAALALAFFLLRRRDA
jgi:hypothetical protein